MKTILRTVATLAVGFGLGKMPLVWVAWIAGGAVLLTIGGFIGYVIMAGAIMDSWGRATGWR